jgi:molybdopterin-guanine dinucleotide biosynthesis adapter protein
VTLISSPRQIGMVRDADHDHTLAELGQRFLPDVDLILTEGYKREAWPKVEVHRKELARPLLATPAEGLIAVVTDEPMPVDVPHFGLDEAARLAAFLTG